MGNRFEQAKGNFKYGKWLRTVGREEESKANLQEAYSLFMDIGAKAYKERTAHLLGVGKEKETVQERFLDKSRLSSIIHISQHISSILNLNELLENILNKALEVTGAQRGFLFVPEGEGKTENLELIAKKSIYDSLDHTETLPDKEKVSKKIIKRSYINDEIILTTNAQEDDKYRDYKSVIQYRLKSIVCIPIKYKNEIKAICYLDNPLAAGIFSKEDIEILKTMMVQAAISIENARLYKELLFFKNKAKNIT